MAPPPVESPNAPAAQAATDEREQKDEETSRNPQQQSSGFGMSLSNITADVQRRLRLDDNVKGAVVVDVDQASPAARAGIMEGDVITRVGRTSVGSVADASRELGKIASGGTAILRINRGGTDMAVVVTKE